MAAPIVTAQALEKSFGSDAILRGVEVSIHDGERVGLVGANGAGKSTLAKILAGALAPDAGGVHVRNDARVVYLPQEPSLRAGATAIECALEGLAEWSDAFERHRRAGEALEAGDGNLDAHLREQANAAAEVERLGGWDRSHLAESFLERLSIDPSHGVDKMSGGERRRVDLARVLVARPTLAVLDEPTNHLDVDTIEWLEGFLRDEHPGALLLVTHDRYVLDRVVTRTVELERGAVHSYPGGWEDYLTAKAERQTQEARTERNRQNFLRTELEWLRRQPKARTGKSKARIDRALEAKDSKLERSRDQVRNLALQTTRLGGTILEMRDLDVDVAGRRLVAGLTLSLQRGERIGIIGPNGIGKSSLLRVLVGELEPAGGELEIGKNTRFAYFDQARSSLDDDASILENVAGKRRRLQIGDRDVDAHAWLDGWLFSADKQRAKVGTLSGGERARVALAKLLLEPANVLLLDEPTNDLDVHTLGALEAMLFEAQSSCLVVTHDRYFLDRVATSILAFEGGAGAPEVVRFVGNWSTYRDLRRASKSKPGAGSGSGSAKGPGGRGKKKESKAQGGLTYGERIELDGILAEVTELEADVERLQGQLADPALYQDRGHEVPGLQQSLDDAETRLLERMERWETLEAKKAGET